MTVWNPATDRGSGLVGCLACLLLAAAPISAAELTGRASLLGTAGWAGSGDLGATASGSERLTGDQQALRLMLDEAGEHGEWSLHVNTRRLHLDGMPLPMQVPVDRFRYRSLAHDWIDDQGADSVTRAGYAVDRAFYRHRFDQLTVGIGRQPIDWGTGRFWQPMNVFGAFAPTDLDTDFKPGIDALVADWYPSPLSSLTVAWVLSPQHDPAEDSAAAYFRRQVGMQSELALLAGRVRGENVTGAALQGEVRGMGWRVEGVRHGIGQGEDGGLSWIAGVDYQLRDGTLLTAEWRDHGGTTIPSEPLTADTMRPEDRRVLGLGASRDLTPLLQGGYTLLVSPLRGADGSREFSWLHQLNLTWSMSNESDLLLSLLHADGRGLDATGHPRSAFGHLPTTVTLRYRHYF
ncbi:hypothetical protein [Guyparkeria sp.]|uniref:hypothetical protein n=2 Tax=Chromatiales TaxID=135613 RepID=UPI0035678B13